MKSWGVSLMVWYCFGPHFRVHMKGHEKTDHKRNKSLKGPTMKRQIMNIFIFTKNLLWLIYEPLVAKGLRKFLFFVVPLKIVHMPDIFQNGLLLRFFCYKGCQKFLIFDEKSIKKLTY
jgi:hypothetical protein